MVDYRKQLLYDHLFSFIFYVLHKTAKDHLEQLQLLYSIRNTMT